MTAIRLPFADRAHAGRALAQLVGHLRDRDPVVLGLPRGGVPVAAVVAEALDAPLDVIIVRKLGVPWHPELAMGAIGEDGVKVLGDDVIRSVGVTAADVARVEAAERVELDRRAARYRTGRTPIPLRGRAVVVVDDGIATGATVRAACLVARAAGAAAVTIATPVAPVGWTRDLADVADELIAAATPDPFVAIGLFYDDFLPTSDAEVIACLERAEARSRRRGTPGADGVSATS